MPNEELMSVKEFREILKNQGFASDGFSDSEIKDCISLLSGLAHIQYKFCKNYPKEQ